MTGFAKSVGIALLTVLMSGPALAAGGLPSAPPVAARQTSVPVAERTAPAAAAFNTEDYAARERNAKALEDFVGGHGGVYIGGGAVTVLLVILLVILIV